jgi:hypothetical protein
MNLSFEGNPQVEPNRKLFDWLKALGYAPQEKPVFPMELAGFVLHDEYTYNLTVVENSYIRRVVAKSFIRGSSKPHGMGSAELDQAFKAAFASGNIDGLKDSLLGDHSHLANLLNNEQQHCVVSVEGSTLTLAQTLHFRDEISPELWRCFLAECNHVVEFNRSHPLLKGFIRE